MRIGLIGAGRWGKRYIETLSRIPGIELTHLASKNPDSSLLVSSACKIITHWQDLLKERLDGIIIATPPQTHFEIASAAIIAGIPILIEKPMTLSLLEARKLVQAATDYGVLTMVGHTHLFSAAFRKLKIISQRMGKLKHIISLGGNWGPFRIDTPPLWDWAPHDIAMSLELTGNYPLHIEAKRIEFIEQSQGIGETVNIMLSFDSGSYADIQVSNIQKNKTRFFEAVYENGSLVYDDLADNKLVLSVSSEAVPTPIILDKSLSLTNLVYEFSHAISAGNRYDRSLHLGLQVVEVLDECQRRLTGK
ncbi:MAG: Gfo/Idh/MocA family oxidoreductase [Candidatus Omnitrophota bacterium]